MSIDQEAPETQVEAEVEHKTANEESSHTEVGEHEYTIEELKKELEEVKQKANENWDKVSSHTSGNGKPEKKNSKRSWKMHINLP